MESLTIRWPRAWGVTATLVATMMISNDALKIWYPQFMAIVEMNPSSDLQQLSRGPGAEVSTSLAAGACHSLGDLGRREEKRNCLTWVSNSIPIQDDLLILWHCLLGFDLKVYFGLPWKLAMFVNQFFFVISYVSTFLLVQLYVNIVRAPCFG